MRGGCPFRALSSPRLVGCDDDHRRDRARHQGLDLGARAAVPRVRLRRRRRAVGRTCRGWSATTRPRGRGAGAAATRPTARPPASGRRWSTPATSATCTGVFDERVRADARPRTSRASPTGTRTRPRSRAATASRTRRPWRPSWSRRPHAVAERLRLGHRRRVAAARAAAQRRRVHRRDPRPLPPARRRPPPPRRRGAGVSQRRPSGRTTRDAAAYVARTATVPDSVRAAHGALRRRRRPGRAGARDRLGRRS